MDNGNIINIDDNEINTSFLEELNSIENNQSNIEEEIDDQKNSKIKLPDWDLIPPFETVDRSDDND